jgi:hypothetical protein
MLICKGYETLFIFIKTLYKREDWMATGWLKCEILEKTTGCCKGL